MSSHAIFYKNGVNLKTINGVGYLGATPPEEATPPPPPPGGSHAPPPPRRKPRPPDIFSFDQRTKNPRSAPAVKVVLQLVDSFKSRWLRLNKLRCKCSN